MNIVITQSNYIPWKGYFDAINTADYFVIFDEMQYTRRDWRNRNKIKTSNGLQWLTIPVEVKGKYFQKINETRIADKNWGEKHWRTLSHTYAKAPCFHEVADLVKNWFEKATLFDSLTEVNVFFLRQISDYLKLNTKFLYSRDFDLLEDKTTRLVKICEQLDGSNYYTGRAAENYLDELQFNKASIRLHYFDYSGYKKYPQLHGEFEHGVSILDMIFMLGKNARFYLKETP